MGLLYQIFGIRPTEMWEFCDALERRPGERHSVKVCLDIYEVGSGDYVWPDIYTCFDYIATLPNGREINLHERIPLKTFLYHLPEKSQQRLILDEIEAARARFGENLDIKMDRTLSHDLSGHLESMGVRVNI